MLGTITYKKPRELLTDNEKACVDWLAYNGISPTVNKEDPNAAANIDLTIEGELWEMKNVTNASSVSNQFNRIRAKWGKLGMAEPVRAVFSTEGAKIPFSEIVAEVAKRVHPGERFIVLSEKGDLEKVEAEPCPDS